MYCKIKVFDKDDLIKAVKEHINEHDTTFGIPFEAMGKEFYGRLEEIDTFKYYSINVLGYIFSVPVVCCEVIEENIQICKVCKYGVKHTCNRYTDCADCPMADSNINCKCTFSYDKYTNTCNLFEEEELKNGD